MANKNNWQTQTSIKFLVICKQLLVFAQCFLVYVVIAKIEGFVCLFVTTLGLVSFI